MASIIGYFLFNKVNKIVFAIFNLAARALKIESVAERFKKHFEEKI